MTINTGPILVVEDIGAVRELIEVQLKMRGYRVQTARDGLEALEFIAAEMPAVIVTDILMPRMDGFALAHQLRSNPLMAGVPIIFLSATYVTVEDEQFALTLGAMRFLPKPVDSDELFVAVADALTGQDHHGPPMLERDFYSGYRQRLENKLRQKAAQVARNNQQLEHLPEDQRETYRRLLSESQVQYDEIQHELMVLSNLLEELAMSARAAPRYSRRSFLKFGAVAAAGVLALRLPTAPVRPGSSFLRVKSALPLPGYAFYPFPERLVQGDLGHVDAALVPAYVAAQLIQKHLLQPIDGPAGRAHDPEGRYTVPFAYRVAALRFRDTTTAPAAASWGDLWTVAGGAVWPAFGRVITGAALLRRGYSPNDAHPGHLAQAADDLKRLRPLIVPEVTRRDQDWQRVEKPLALVLADPADLGQANGLRLPAQATMLVEYDWVITGGLEQAAAARQFIDGLRPAAQTYPVGLPTRLIPLMPASPSAHIQHREIWVSLTAERA